MQLWIYIVVPDGAFSMRDTLKKILGRAVNAPSGDNSQPWRFALEENTISVFNVPGADETLYNFRERGSYFAHGALVENICLVASVEGLEASVHAFPGDTDCTARIIFENSSAPADPLSAFLEKRCTNRKPYELRALTPKDTNVLHGAVKGPVELKLVEGDAVRFVAAQVSVNERIVMENRALHDFLFGMIRLNPEEERRKPGLNIDTMEFPPPQRFALKFLKYWNIVQALNLIGFSRLAPKGSAVAFSASGALGVLIIQGESDTDFFTAGRAFERLWLAATGSGVSIQPLAALPYLFQRVRVRETDTLSAKHIGLIKEAYGNICRAFGADSGDTIAMLFRLGYGPEPTARSLKLPPRIT